MFVVVVIAVIGLLTVLSLTGRQRFLTPSPPHLQAASDAECLTCHDEGTEVPMLPEHPLRKKNCRQCHRLKR